MSETMAPMPKLAALRWLVHNSPVTVASYTELAEVFGWERAKTWKVVQEWRRKGYLETNTAPDTGSLTVAILPNVLPLGASDDTGEGESDTVREGAAPLPSVSEPHLQQVAPPEENGNAPREHRSSEPAVDTVYARYVDQPRETVPPADALDWLARMIAIGMACITAYFSIHGLLTLFPGDEIGVTVFGVGVEALKVGGVMYLSRHARTVWWLWRWAAIAAIVIAAGLNSASVYAKFASLHSQSPAAAAATREASAAELDARIEQFQGRVNDLTRRAAVLDDATNSIGKKATASGTAKTLNNVRPERASLSTDRDSAATELARLKAQRGRITAADHQASAEELPLLLMANLTGTDMATVLRWLVCAVVICGDPAALVLLAAVGSRRRREGGAA
jgi:hypothetical protein